MFNANDRSIYFDVVMKNEIIEEMDLYIEGIGVRPTRQWTDGSVEYLTADGVWVEIEL